MARAGLAPVRDEVAPGAPGAAATAADRHVLVLLDPRGRDAEVVSALFGRVGITCHACRGLAALADAAGDEAVGAGLVAEEVLRGGDLAVLQAGLARQPPWSDLPLVVLTRSPATPRRDPYAAGLAEALGTAVFLERPLRAATLISAMRAAMRARQRQLQLRDDLAEREAAARRQAMLLHELNHRVKNTLATVQGIATQTLRADADPAAARSAFLARLLALAKTHDLLTATAWTGSSVRDVILAEVVPFRDEARPGRVALEGPEVGLTPNATVALGMAVHELLTNAVKYGALSMPAGRVTVAWTSPAANGPGGRRLQLTWTERDGPPVAPPTRRGFGSRLIERGLAHELGGTARITFAPEGVRCTMDLTLAEGTTLGALG